VLDASRPKQLTLTWTAPANGGSPITSYVVYRSTTGSPIVLTNVAGALLSYLDAGVVRGVSYDYWVAACNAIGCGPLSMPVAGAAH
jgi:hypothetical protein